MKSQLSEKIIRATVGVHRSLWLELLESAYREYLFYELKQKNISLRKEISLLKTYKEIKLDHVYRIKLLVENKIVIKLKTVECFTNVHFTHFNIHEPWQIFQENGIKRFINTSQ